MVGHHAANNCPEVEEGRVGFKVQLTTHMSCLLHMRWNPWVQGDRRKLYVTQEKIKMISMKLYFQDGTNLYVKGRGWEHLGTGLRFIRNTIFGAWGPRILHLSGKV